MQTENHVRKSFRKAQFGTDGPLTAAPLTLVANELISTEERRKWRLKAVTFGNKEPKRVGERRGAEA